MGRIISVFRLLFKSDTCHFHSHFVDQSKSFGHNELQKEQFSLMPESQSKIYSPVIGYATQFVTVHFARKSSNLVYIFFVLRNILHVLIT